MAKPIYIDNFQKGVASSPYLGTAKIVGLDIFRKPGVIQVGSALVNDGKTYSGVPTAEVISSNGTKFIGTSDGHLYMNGAVLNANVGGRVDDLLIVQDCLLIFKSQSTIDLYANISAAPTYNANWKTGLETSVFGWKKSIVGQDNIIYFGNETKLGSLTSFTVSGSTATATLNTSCLSSGLPQGRVVQTICELNRYVTISTSAQGNGFDNTKLYFMDRFMKDALGTSFYLSMGVDIPERKVTQMITKNNRLYFFGSDTGSFYTANTSTYQVITVLPNRQLAQQYNVVYPATPNSVALVNNEILFGIGGDYNSAFDTPYGVYSLRDNAVICKHIISTGGYGQTNAINIGAICVTGNSYYDVGWKDGTNVGVDTAGTTLATSYKAWFETAFYETGTAKDPRFFETIQFNFGPNLVSNQKLRVSYRSAQNKAWSTPIVYDYATYGAVNSLHGKFPTEGTTNLQLKVEFDTTGSIYGENIELQSIILE